MPSIADHGFRMLAHIGKVEVSILFAAVWGAIFYRILTGSISTRGMLADSSGPISPAKIQMLIGTLSVASAIVAGGGTLEQMSSNTAAAVAGGTNLLYLARKYLQPPGKGT